MTGSTRRRRRLGLLIALGACALAYLEVASTTSRLSAAVLNIPSALLERDGGAVADRIVLDLPIPSITGEGGSVSERPADDAAAFAASSPAHRASSRRREEAGYETSPAPDLRIVTVERGDSLYTIFRRLELDQAQMLLLTRGEGAALKRLHPGQVLEFQIDDDGSVERLVYRLNAVSSLHFHAAGSGYRAERVEEPYEHRRAIAFGTIESSLFISAQKAGVSDKVIMQMAEIFGWDIDFALDIRTGDSFVIVFEQLYKDGEKVRDGEILGAEFVNRGRSLRAVRYTDETGHSQYYSPRGESMRKAFLRTPVKFSRISSHFNLARKHPILHTIRAHKGVDYAAPTGTAVKATGDGKVTLAGKKGGYGNTVVVRHGGVYTTLYAHLSKLAKGVRPGALVRQGQVIGYVGSTGLATGPHLHYEFQVRGVHRDPLKVELPKAAPIAEDYREDFLEKTRDMVAQLDLLSRMQLAATE